VVGTVKVSRQRRHSHPHPTPTVADLSESRRGTVTAALYAAATWKVTCMEQIVSDRLLLPDGRLGAGVVAFDGPCLVDPGQGSAPWRRWNARGHLVLPGMVDLHGDGFERQVMPRPGVSFPLDTALLDTDRQLVANGITTAFHAVTYSFEPGLRGRAGVVAFLAAMARLRARLACDTRIHLRQEAFNLEGVDEICGWIGEGRIDLLAFNDHTPPLIEKARRGASLQRYVERTSLDEREFTALLLAMAERADEVPAATARLATAARAAGVWLASHDDETAAMREGFRALGCRIADFPKTVPAATAARAGGDPIILGAPNIVRGGSQSGAVDAAQMVESGLCDVLSSDYYYPAMLGAVARLAADGVAPLHALWRLVAENPARAMGLADRGRIEPGLRADLVLVDWPEGGVPSVARTFAADRDGMGSGRP